MKYQHIRVEVNSTIRPIDSLITSKMRGAFGHFLKNITCILPSYNCKNCPYIKECTYYKFYETDDAPPFRFDAKLYADSYDFGIYIFDENPQYLRPIIAALRSMLQAKTISDKKLSFPHSAIFLNDIKLNFDERDILLPFSVAAKELHIARHYKDIEIQFTTPLYLKSSKSKFKESLSLEDILLSIYKRKYYFEQHKKVFALDYTPTYTLISSEYKIFKEKTRSDRQKKYLDLLGIIGRMILVDVDEKSFELLKWGEVLALGNKVAKGQGAIHLKL